MNNLSIGDRIEVGIGDDYDVGIIVDIDGDRVTVAWESGVRTTQPAAVLR